MNLSELTNFESSREDLGEDLNLPAWIKGNPELISAYRNADVALTVDFWRAQETPEWRQVIRRDIERLNK